MNYPAGKTRVVPDMIRAIMREGRESSIDQRLEDSLYQSVLGAEMQVRGCRFLPRQAIKAPLRKAVSESKRDGSCVLANGMKVFVPLFADTLANASGFAK